MQNETPRASHWISLEWLRSKTDIMECWWEPGIQKVQPHWTTVWQFPIKLDRHWAYPQSNSIPSHLPKGNINYAHTKIRMWLFIKVLFIIAKKWKHSNGNHGDWWMAKAGSISTMECSSAIQSNKLWTRTRAMDEAQEYYTKEVKPDPKDHRLYDSIYVTFLKRQ